MRIAYQELISQDDFNQCIEMQRSLFNMSDVDIISPLILQLIARENPPMGIMLGAFNMCDEKKELIGFILSMATFKEKSIYGMMMGVKPEYQSQGHGLTLFLKLREIAIHKNIDYFYGVFEPLEKKLGHLYIHRLGFTGTHYQESVYSQFTNDKNYVSPDKVLLKWDLSACSSQDGTRNNSNELLRLYPIATKVNKPDSPFVLVEIPNDFNLMKKEDIPAAKHWRSYTKDIFIYYLNQRNYIVCDCLTFEDNLNKRSFYLLKAQ